MNGSADVLRAARAKIENPMAWTQGRLSADEFGEFVYPHDIRATCFCAQGAILSAQHVLKWAPAESGSNTPGLWISQAARALGFETAREFNDAPATAHEDVLALFDLAIRLAESAESCPS